MVNAKAGDYEMKKHFLLICLICICSLAFAQESIKAELEYLGSIPVSKNNTEKGTVSFYCDDYEGYFPLGPLVDDKGNIYFYNYFNDSKIVFKNGKVIQETIKRTENGNDFPMSLNATSSNGFITGSNSFWLYKNDKHYEMPEEGRQYSRFTDFVILKNGILYLYSNPSKNYAVDISGNESKLLESEQIENWLYSMGYTVKDNLIYKNNKLIASLESKKGASDSHGYLRSYHQIYYKYSESFVIADLHNNEELQINLPQDKINNNNFIKFTYGFGNYGEIYILSGPEDNKSRNCYSPSAGNAELYVIRNHLKYFGILNDDRIRLRKGPGTDTESLGTYPIKTGFRILESSGVKQTIGGVTDEWIKVRLLDGTEGYFFGQYVQNLYDGPGTSLPWPNVADWD